MEVSIETSMTKYAAEHVNLIMKYISKCFTYVTKTIANSTTYSRKPGDYNGTIIFEFDIMKNSSPLNLKFIFFATLKTKNNTSNLPKLRRKVL